jgi:hypothetical protein
MNGSYSDTRLDEPRRQCALVTLTKHEPDSWAIIVRRVRVAELRANGSSRRVPGEGPCQVRVRFAPEMTSRRVSPRRMTKLKKWLQSCGVDPTPS